MASGKRIRTHKDLGVLSLRKLEDVCVCVA
jgi:hypothetical protein